MSVIATQNITPTFHRLPHQSQPAVPPHAMQISSVASRTYVESYFTKLYPGQVVLVLCEYSKFRMELLLQYSIWFKTSAIIEYLPSPISYLTEWRQFFTLATTPSNQQNQQTWNCLLSHYGPPSTETNTTETITVRCHKISWIYLSSTYYWWLFRPTITIRFDLKWKKNTIRTALICTHTNSYASQVVPKWQRQEKKN